MASHTNMYKDLHFETYEAGEDVLNKMYEIARDYGKATMSDLMDLIGCRAVFADTKFYWTAPMLAEADTIMGPSGWTAKLPDPVHECNKVKVSYLSHGSKSSGDKRLYIAPLKPQPVYITINRDVYEDVDDVLKSLFKQMACLPGREFHITIE